tara:strand:- start:573 stop:1526 length:954 start_codon:yes stop_codon:yes gene_type:complete
MFADIINNINEKQLSILVIGDLMLDKFIFGNVNRISPEAPVPIVKLKKEEQMLGGCGNVIRNLNNLGVTTKLISVVGRDSPGDLLIKKLLEKEIPIDNVLRLDNIRTTEKMRIVADRQQVVRVDCDMNQLTIDSIDTLITNMPKCIKKINGIIISDYAKGVCSEFFLKKVIKLSSDKNIPVYIDPKGSDWEKYKNADLITPNTSETEAVLGQKLENDKDFEMAGKEICSAFNIKACLITRGSDGMSLIRQKNIIHLKSKAKEIFDVSGAGDTVIAAMATGLLTGADYKKVLEFSNVAAGIVVGHVGTSAITIEELLD